MARAAEDICESVSNEPWAWRLDHCTYTRTDGVRIWRANVPILNTSIYAPNEMGLGLKDKVRVWWAFRKWKQAMPLVGYTKPEGK